MNTDSSSYLLYIGSVGRTKHPAIFTSIHVTRSHVSKVKFSKLKFSYLLPLLFFYTESQERIHSQILNSESHWNSQLITFPQITLQLTLHPQLLFYKTVSLYPLPVKDNTSISHAPFRAITLANPNKFGNHQTYVSLYFNFYFAYSHKLYL